MLLSKVYRTSQRAWLRRCHLFQFKLNRSPLELLSLSRTRTHRGVE